MIGKHALIAVTAWVGALGGGAVAAASLVPGTISIEAGEPDGAADPSRAVFANALDEALSARGFTMLQQPGHAALVAELQVTREEIGSAPAKIAADRPQIAGGGAGGSVGAGASFSLPTGKSAIVPLQRIRLDVKIHQRGQAEIMWQGAAITVRAAGTRRGADPIVAADLTAAILRDYPAPPESVITVP